MISTGCVDTVNWLSISHNKLEMIKRTSYEPVPVLWENTNNRIEPNALVVAGIQPNKMCTKNSFSQIHFPSKSSPVGEIAVIFEICLLQLISDQIQFQQEARRV